MAGTAEAGEDFPTSFEVAFARLRLCIERACAGTAPWPDRAAEAVRRALEFAAADVNTADVLTNEALAHGAYGAAHYDHLLGYLGGLLRPGRALAGHGDELPDVLERALAGGVVTIVASRVATGRADELPGIVPEAIKFVLTPYVGAEEAAHLATVKRA